MYTKLCTQVQSENVTMGYELRISICVEDWISSSSAWNEICINGIYSYDGYNCSRYRNREMKTLYAESLCRGWVLN